MEDFKALAAHYQQVLSEIYPATEISELFLLVYCHITKKRRVDYALDKSSMPSKHMQDVSLAILGELKQGRPIQHILGEAAFYGLQLAVNEHTLIPRPETEELVDWIVMDHKSSRSLSILDIGTGSGCIAIALKKHLPRAQVTAIDISAEAIAVAKANATRHQTEIDFMVADILEWDCLLQDGQKFDVIVSNPPYITQQEKLEMHQNVLAYEPHSALFVEDHAPLLFYDTIANIGRKHLVEGGKLFFEINQYLGKETVELLQKKGYASIELRQDINLADRMVKALR